MPYSRTFSGGRRIASAPNTSNTPLPSGANTGNYWWSDPNVLIEDQGIPDDKPYLQREPYLLADEFSRIQQEGVYGEGGISSLMRTASSASGLRRRKLGSALKRGRLGRQLGPRSGAINNLLANKAWAPELAGLTEMQFDLLAKNLLSKTSVGTEGLRSIMEFIQNRYNTRANRDADSQGGGFLDFIGPIADIAALIPGPQQAPAAAASSARRFE